MRLKCFLLLSILLCFGCQERFDKKIAKHIEQKCKNNADCIINISDITNFNWDTMYVFDRQSTEEEVDKILGFSFPCDDCSGIRYKIIFTLKNKLVYQAIEDYNVEYSDWKIWFGDVVSQHDPLILKKELCVFLVKRSPREGNSVYYLSPVQTNIPFIK